MDEFGDDFIKEIKEFNMKQEDIRIIKLKEIEFEKSDKLFVPIGFDINGEYIIEDLRDLKSIIMAGATGSGKSMFGHTTIISLLKQNNDIEFILCDMKRVEFGVYNNINKVYLDPTSTKEQFKLIDKELNKRLKEKSSYEFKPIFIVIDEFSDLMGVDGAYFEEKIVDIAKNGPALNIYIMLYTSRPSPDSVTTKKIVNSFNTKIAFAVASENDSKTILGISGAEKLLGKGDMLFKKGDETLRRLQSFYISDEEIEEIVKEHS